MWRSAPASWDNLPESKVLGDETLRTVRVAIDGLPPKQREVILLRDVAGLEAAEVSTALGISPANERVRLHRARAAVRKALEEYLR
jgi:RNA polymerase sigma-70 factor (ECF subfamily)